MIKSYDFGNLPQMHYPDYTTRTFSALPGDVL